MNTRAPNSIQKKNNNNNNLNIKEVKLAQRLKCGESFFILCPNQPMDLSPPTLLRKSLRGRKF